MQGRTKSLSPPPNFVGVNKSQKELTHPRVGVYLVMGGTGLSIAVMIIAPLDPEIIQFTLPPTNELDMSLLSRRVA
jgi:hypothetical protein